MNDQTRNWLQKNGPMIALATFAVLALLYLGDSIVNQQNARIQLQPIPPVVSSIDPIQGNIDGEVTVIEFGEFSCSACALQVDIIKDVLNDYGEHVAFVWKDAPLDSLQPETRLASIAAQCANRQNKFWEMYEELFKKYDSLGRDLYVSIAEDLELDIEQFTTCFDGRETNAVVDANIESATDARVSATPTFYINGVRYERFLEYDEFIQAFSQ